MHNIEQVLCLDLEWLLYTVIHIVHGLLSFQSQGCSETRIVQCQFKRGCGGLERVYARLTLNGHRVSAHFILVNVKRLESPLAICFVKGRDSANIAANVRRVCRKAAVGDITAWWHRLERIQRENDRIGIVEVVRWIGLDGRLNAFGINAGVNQVDLGRLNCGNDH